MSELPASERRRREARSRGEVAMSPLACATGALAGATLALKLVDVSGVRALSREAFAGTLGSGSPTAALLQASSLLVRLVAPVALAALVGALAVGLVQTRALFAIGAFGRRAERRPRLVRWLLAIVVATVATVTMRARLHGLARAGDLAAVEHTLSSATRTILVGALIAFAAFALVHWAWRRWLVERSLRMTRTEAEAERRQDEADPRVRAELRRRAKPPRGDGKS